MIVAAMIEGPTPAADGPTPPPALDAPAPPAAALERAAMAWPEPNGDAADGAWRPDAWWAPPSLLPPTDERIDAPPSQAEVAVPPRFRPARLVREVAETLVLAGLMLVVLLTLVRNYKIEGTSMAPTLAPAEYILVDKLAYRVFGDPDRGDVVVFRDWNDEQDYIKRIIGLPGEAVDVRDGRVFIDGMPLDEPYLQGAPTGGGGGPTVLGPDDYFVLGDNRGNSSDSRVHGPLQRDHIVGRAWLTYWPLSRLRRVAHGEAAYAGSGG